MPSVEFELTEIADIKDAISNKESDLDALRTRMNEDFDLLTLVDYEKISGYEGYTSSAPKNFFDKVTDGLNRSSLRFDIKLPEDAKEEEQREATIGELFLHGAFAEMDRSLIARGEAPLRESLGFFINLRGWYAFRLLVYVPKGKTSVKFDGQPWDPLHITWEQGANGLIWAAYKTTITKAQAKSEYGVDIAGKEAEKIDYFDACNNAVIIGNVWGKPPEAHEIGHVPVLIGAVGSMPTLQPSLTGVSGSANPVSTLLEFRGDSVWASSRKLYEPHNKYVSQLMDIQKRSTVGSLLYETETGTKDVIGDPYESWQIVQIKTGEKLGPLALPVAPPETAAILGLINADIQQSTLPYPLAYGGTTEAMSGRALSMLSDATRSVYSPRSGALARVYSWGCEELLIQFNKKIKKTSTLRGFKDEVFFEVEAKPKRINPNWFVSVRVEPIMPRDREAEISMALAATSRRSPDDVPLVSKATAREEYLRLRDPNAEEDKALAEIGKSLPPVIATQIAAALKRKGEDELAELVMQFLRSQLGGQTPTNGQQPQAPQPAQAQGAPSTEPAQVQTPGVEDMPPELARVIVAVVEALASAGQQQLADQFLSAIQQGSLTPEMLKPIIEALMQLGQEQLADSLLSALGMQVAPTAPTAPMPNVDQRLENAGLVRGRA